MRSAKVEERREKMPSFLAFNWHFIEFYVTYCGGEGATAARDKEKEEVIGSWETHVKWPREREKEKVTMVLCCMQ